ncbi:uncharacterized protein LOC62_07G009013 [Vanrija pseudolonga]|uniref:Uncharacterized protein n=1 Tax=Vanrija pseudolonga TaxID=143232 RepID=A0AAF1BR46_9TREE|nr:hypothetical protein LOC62_07G009013 [Vanrija pseudolonga]
MLALRRLAPATLRSLHTSAPAAKKAKAVEFEEEDFDDAGDLFDGAQVEAASGDRGARRAALSDSILNRTSVRIGDLRKVVQLSDSVEDLQQLGTVLKSWRAQGKKVTDQTAVEIVGRCIRFGQQELAHTYVSHKVQYGIPTLPAHVYNKIAPVKGAKEAKTAAEEVKEAPAAAAEATEA